MATARWLDREKGLQARSATAVELLRAPAPTAWRELVVSDAAKQLQHLNLKDLLRLTLPKAATRMIPVLAVTVVLGLLPEYRTKPWRERQRDQAVIQENGERLAELTRRSLETRPPALEDTRTALEAVEELGGQLAKGSLTRVEALRDLASAADKLQQQMRELGKSPAFRSMEKAARSSERGGRSSQPDLQKQMDALQKSLGDQPKDPDALDKLKRQVQQAKEAAANLPEKESAEAAAAREQMAQSLSDLARQATDLGLALPALAEAIAALAASQTDLLVRDLRSAEIELDKMQAMAQALQEMQNQADPVGQSLSEQLEFGQTEAARDSLKQMSEQLSRNPRQSEQLQKLLEELAKAIPAAKQYDPLGKTLEKARQQLSDGQGEEAAKTLAQASDELNQMLQEMGDAQSMLASLEAMQQAQSAIANGQSWSQAKAQPRASRGEGVGRGVGTWGDDSRWMSLEDIKDKWDNSGVVRDDEESRGVTERDSSLTDNLAPTKIRGQVNPGGPMPSIALKGVSIRGMSSLDVQAATQSAQDAAQSALSQEQVPRAYRTSVRTYFDDLKK